MSYSYCDECGEKFDQWDEDVCQLCQEKIYHECSELTAKKIQDLTAKLKEAEENFEGEVRESDRLLKELNSTRARLKRATEALESVAEDCLSCPNTGMIYTAYLDPPEQCEFCYQQPNSRMNINKTLSKLKGKPDEA